MASIHEELEQFHRFAAERIEHGGAPSSLEEILVEWCDSQSREEVNESIRSGMADVEAGRYEPADEAMEAVRKWFALSNQ